MNNLHIVSYATGRFLNYQNILEEKCYIHGAEKVHKYTFFDLDNEFKKNNINALSFNKGAGYWCWKPYLILKTLDKLQKNDVIIYLDSGVFPIVNLKEIISNEDIISFDVCGQINLKWTKYDCFYLMNCLEEKYLNSFQKNGAFQIYKNTNKSKEFLEEYKYYCELDKNRCIDDQRSILGKENLMFLEHRHDQSVFTNLCIKYNLKSHRDPSQWGNLYIKNYEDNYPQIFNHHRGNYGI